MPDLVDLASDLSCRLQRLTDAADAVRCEFELVNGPSYDLEKPLDRAMAALLDVLLANGWRA